MKKAFIGVAVCALSSVFSFTAHAQQAYKGQICLGTAAGKDASQSQPQCAVAHVKRGDKYVFVNSQDKTVYQIDGKKPKAFAGRNVVLIGTLDKAAATIHVSEIYGALPPKITQAKTVYIDCDACPRGMAVAWRTAFEELTEWGKYDIVPDPMKADLILILSANPYLGDYATRDGPDKRPVHVDITYMNIVDPHSGANLWGDWKQLGSFLVSRATKDLIVEFKHQLLIQEVAGKT